MSMNHYSYHLRLKEIWDTATQQYQSGNRDPKTFFDDEILTDLKLIGLGVMDVYDYVEDFLSAGYPDFTAFVMISSVRRDYFLTVQQGVPSGKRLDPDTLPPKDAAVRGLVWLPRIAQKAIGKLHGELDADTMFSCGGDRRFLKEHDIHPEEFLRAAWAYEDNVEKLYDWVEARVSR